MAERVADGALARGHESGDIPARRILWIALSLAIVIALCCFGALLLLRSLGGGRIGGWVTPSIDSRSLPPPPGLETRHAATLPDYLREQHDRLETYRWIDRDK